MLAGGLITVSAVGTSVVRRGERADHELTRPDALHRAPDFLDNAAVLVPHRSGLRIAANASVWPKIGPAHTSDRYPHDGIGRFDYFGIGTLLETYVAGSIEHSSLHGRPLPSVTSLMMSPL